MIECIDLAFDHILLAPVSNRKRSRDSDNGDTAAEIITNKRNSSSTGSSRVNDVLAEDAVVCTEINR